MEWKTIVRAIQILYIVGLPSSAVRTTSAPVSTTEPNQRELWRTNFVQNGELLEGWRDNFTEVTENMDLSNLGINQLDERAFADFVTLNELDLSSNKLTSTKNIVAALQTVRPFILNVSHNNLGSLEYDRPTFYDDRSYKQSKTFLFDSKYFWSIDLSHNFLRGIGIDFDVVHLNLSNNLIQCHDAIESRGFYGKPSYVGDLDLSHNFINCQDVFFTPNINTLDMSYNQLQGLDADGLLRGLVLLTKLNLNHNNIRYIHPKAFEDTTRLQHLNLNSNQIRTIYKQVWSPMPYLRYIDLSSNRLEYLEWDTDVQQTSVRDPQVNGIEVNVKDNREVRISPTFTYFVFCNDYRYSYLHGEMCCSKIDMISGREYLVPSRVFGNEKSSLFSPRK